MENVQVKITLRQGAEVSSNDCIKKGGEETKGRGESRDYNCA